MAYTWQEEVDIQVKGLRNDVNVLWGAVNPNSLPKDKPKYLPCPFCGHSGTHEFVIAMESGGPSYAPTMLKRISTRCDKCKAMGPETVDCDPGFFWNKRV